MYRDLQEEAIILHPNKIESNEDMKIKSILTGIMAFTLLTGHAQTNKKMMNHNQLTTPTTPTSMNQIAEKESLQLTTEWDKTFPKSNKVKHEKVTFVNRFGITLAADLYIPNGAQGVLPALAVSGPFGAIKEQASGLYAQTMAEQGFIALAFDPSYTGESGGKPRNLASPDINTEDFSAAVDYLIGRSDVDAERIGIIGICGFGGFAINAAALDTRIKATVAVTMYDISRCMSKGYFDQADSDAQRDAMRRQLNEQRTKDIRAGRYERTVMNPEPADDAPQFMKDYYDYYKTQRGYHARSINSGQGWNMTSNLCFINAPILAYADEIKQAVLLVHGEKAHSRYFSEDTFKRLRGDNKRLLHCSERRSLRLVRWWQKRVHSMERYPGFSDHLHEIMQRIDLFVEQLRQTR